MGSASTQTSGGPHEGTPEITVFSLKVEKDKLARFKAACEPHNRSMAQQLRHYMDQMVRDHEANEAA
jgi:hypothetical protein